MMRAPQFSYSYWMQNGYSSATRHALSGSTFKVPNAEDMTLASILECLIFPGRQDIFVILKEISTRDTGKTYFRSVMFVLHTISTYTTCGSGSGSHL